MDGKNTVVELAKPRLDRRKPAADTLCEIDKSVELALTNRRVHTAHRFAWDAVARRATHARQEQKTP